MNRKKLAKLRRQISALRRRSGAIEARELVLIAKAVGRQEVNRGKEPTYERLDSSWWPLTIPGHRKTLKKGTACSVLRQLEDDLDCWDDELPPRDDDPDAATAAEDSNQESQE